MYLETHGEVIYLGEAVASDERIIGWTRETEASSKGGDR
jgi:hypothetical protein